MWRPKTVAVAQGRAKAATLKGKIAMWEIVSPQWMPNVRDLCKKSYCNHPKGCPNYGKRSSCPPYRPFWSDIFHLGAPSYAIWNKFDFASHCERMRIKHPNWSKRQIECCLYWQSKAKKQLKAEIVKFKREHPQYTVVMIPEAMGINITATMKMIGVELQWPPVDITYQIALASLTWGQGSRHFEGS